MYQKFSFVAIQIQMIKFLSHKHTSTSLASLYWKAGERTNLQKMCIRDRYLAVGYIASILFLIMLIATAVYLKHEHITLSICFALTLLPFANHLANGTFTVVIFNALIMFIIRSVHLILKASKLKRNTITPVSYTHLGCLLSGDGKREVP